MQRIIAAQKIQEEASKPKSKRALKTKIDNVNKVKKNANDSKDTDKTKAKDKNKLKDSDKKLTKDKTNDSKTKSKKESKDKKEKRNKEHKKDKERKKDKKKKKKDVGASGALSKGIANPQSIDINDDLLPQVFDECKEKMRPVKKALKALDKPDSSLSKSEQKAHYITHLRTIGTRIDECLREFSSDPIRSKEWRNHLWTFVSKFTEYHAKKLYKLYKHSIKTSEQRDSDGNHASRRDRHDRHHGKPPSTHSSSFGPLKRESSGSVPPNKMLKKGREEYNQFQSKPSISYTGIVNAHNPNPSPAPMYSRNSWPKHENPSSSRAIPYERDHRPEHYSKPMYSREDDSDRKNRYPNDRQRYRDSPQASSQGQHSGQYPTHSQRTTQYHQHFFAHSSVSVPINNANQPNQPYPSWSNFNNPRDPSYHRNQTDSYRRSCPDSEEKPPLNR